MFRFLCFAVGVSLTLAAVPSGAHPHPGGGGEPVAGSVRHLYHPVEVVFQPSSFPPDPCFPPWPMSDRQRAECWIAAAFPSSEVSVAVRVAAAESGNSWHPWVENFGQFRDETGERWTPERARYVAVEDRRGWKVYGLFQHRWEYWEERTFAAGRFHGWAGTDMDPFDGWHNTLVAAWLAGTEGWFHWDVCAESAPSVTEKFRCGHGRWL